MDVIQLTLLLVVIVGIAIYTAIVAVVTRLFHTPIVDTPPALPTNSPIEVNLRLVLLPGTTEGDIAQMIRGITIKKMPICASPQGLNDANIVKSLVPSITDDDWVATTRFFPTDAFVEYSRGGNQLSGQLVFKDHRVTYDDHFHNLTPLYSPDATRDGDAIIVAITGVGGRPIDSWKSGDFMWLRDALGQDLQRRGLETHVLTYGYRSRLIEAGNAAGIEDYGKALLNELMQAWQGHPTSGKRKRFIFVAHSFGGIVLKQALLQAQELRTREHEAFFSSIACIVMMGVPNLGLHNEAFLDMTRGQKNEGLIDLLGFGSKFLGDLDDRFLKFRGSYPGCEVITVYETTVTPTQEKQTDGTWVRKGKPVMMVPHGSACSRGVKSDDSWPSFTNHSDLSKFEYRSNFIYRSLLRKFAAILSQEGQGSDQPNTSLDPSQIQGDLSVGRQSVIARMNNCLSVDIGTADSTPVPIFVLCDVPGMGQTELAQRYGFCHRSMYEAVIWVDASSEDAIVKSFATSDGQTTDASTAIQSELGRLSKLPRPILLIYADLDDDKSLDMIKRHHKPKWTGSIRVVITTCNKKVSSLAPCRNISRVRHLSDGEKNELLQELNPSDPETNADLFELGDKLDWWPPALRAVEECFNRGRSASTVLGWIGKDSLKALKSKDPSCTGSFNIFDIFERTVKLPGSSVGESALALLTLCSFLGGEVHHDLFKLAFSFCRQDNDFRRSALVQRILQIIGHASSSADMVHEELDGLLGLSLIEDHKGFWKLPQIVGTWARSRVTGEGRRSFVVRAASFVYVCAEQLRLTKGEGARTDTSDAYHAQLQLVGYAEVLTKYCADVLDLDLARIVPIECVTTFASWHMHAGRYDVAIKMLEAALDEAGQPDIDIKNTPGAFDDNMGGCILDVIDARRILAWALRKKENLAKAEDEQHKAINALKKLEEFAPKTMLSNTARQVKVRARGELATVYRDRGRLHGDDTSFLAAKREQEKVLQEAILAFGGDCWETRHERSCLSTIYRDAEDWNMVLAYDQENLRSWEKHPESSQRHMSEGRKLRCHLATTLYDGGKYIEAHDIWQKVLLDLEAQGDIRHPERATVMYRLAKACSKEGKDLDKAVEWLDRALEIHRKFGCHAHEASEAADLKKELEVNVTLKRTSSS